MRSIQLHQLDAVDERDKSQLSLISRAILKSRKIVTLTGAGISCNAGIPDFRSSEGLYNMVKTKHPNCIVKGKDLFDISLFRSEETLKIFCTFMESLYSHTMKANPTDTHKFLKKLYDKKKLIKCYTQNIDGIERKLDLNTGTELNWKELDVVQLHGDLNKLSCTHCFKTFEWSNEYREMLQDGETPDCPSCLEKFDRRLAAGKRMSSITVGILRPNIILYGENHPYAENIAKGLQYDLKQNPQILLIFGTSLKVDGVKKLVKNLAKKIHERNDGMVIFINKNCVPLTSWDNIIDFHIQADCDEWVKYLQKEIPDLFLIEKSEIKVTQKTLMTPPNTPSKHRINYILNTTPKTIKKNSLNLKSVASLPINSIPPPTKLNFEIFKDNNNNIEYEYPTPEYSPLSQSKSPRNLNNKNIISTVNNLTSITSLRRSPRLKRIINIQEEKENEIESPQFSPLKKALTYSSQKNSPFKDKNSNNLKSPIKTRKRLLEEITKNSQGNTKKIKKLLSSA
ncbi:hypothetical protein PACTADRAFT_50973 [Pachysolen tannophilus NRRL Y-2460]|uniref:Deacetylase sirtuin-type domain-containing protein n=1 Tax=Pachysolen tannophilus NRRL Y-2460 TaxID=669874 RepID=A0A1E4TQS0_PACTA|nr:hypothetical protein PACTADRAFT_50973 [Pachysolen tannophilus NRRL Y-2460]